MYGSDGMKLVQERKQTAGSAELPAVFFIDFPAGVPVITDRNLCEK